jgi:hypothetical protein
MLPVILSPSKAAFLTKSGKTAYRFLLRTELICQSKAESLLAYPWLTILRETQSGQGQLARALLRMTLQSVVDWPLGKLTYGKN